MKRKAILFVLAAASLTTFAQNRLDVEMFKMKLKRIPIIELVKPAQGTNLVYTTDSVDFEFKPDVTSGGSCSYIGTRVKNKTGERISIEWENAKICGGRIYRANDKGVNPDKEKADEVVLVDEWSELMMLAPRMNVLEPGTLAYGLSSLKKNSGVSAIYNSKNQEPLIVPIILPLHIGENTYDYKFELKFSHYTTAQIDSIVDVYKHYLKLSKVIEVGMTAERVQEIMGQTDQKTEGCLKYPFVEIYLEDNRVTSVKREL